jgi:hypothetical protein
MVLCGPHLRSNAPTGGMGLDGLGCKGTPRQQSARETFARRWGVASGAVLVAVGCLQRLSGQTTGTEAAWTAGARAVTPKRSPSGEVKIPSTSSATTPFAAASTAKRIPARRDPASFAASRSAAGRTPWSAARSAGGSESSSSVVRRGRGNRPGAPRSQDTGTPLRPLGEEQRLAQS